MQHSPSEANRFSASHGIPCILWNPMVHYHIHKCQPPVSILSQLDPVRTPTSYFLKIHLNVYVNIHIILYMVFWLNTTGMTHLKIHLNIILSSMPGSPKWSLSLRFPHQNPVYTSPPYMLHAPPNSVMRTWTEISPAGLSRHRRRPHRLLCSTNTYHCTLCSIPVYYTRDSKGLEMNQVRPRSILQWIWAQQK